MKTLLLIAALSASLAARPAPAAESTEAQLQAATNWLNNAIGGRNASNKGMRLQILPMSVPGYQRFAASSYSAEEGLEIGKPALSAYFQRGEKVDNRPQDVCFLLYNPKSAQVLVSQFIAPHDAEFAAGIAPYAFMVAHELGHCVDFKLTKAPRQRSALQEEIFADAFSITLLRESGVGQDEILSIVKSREHAGDSHATWKWAKIAINQPLPKINTSSIEDFWKVADTLSMER